MVVGGGVPLIVLQLKVLRRESWVDGSPKLSKISTIAKSSNYIAIRQSKGLIIFPTEAASIASARATLLLQDNVW